LRKLTVTLAWFSPISACTQKYRTASLWFQLLESNLVPDRVGLEYNAVQRGTVQHEVFEGERAMPIADGDVLRVKVNCREDAGKINGPVPYGLVVSLEVAEGVNVPIYQEVSERIMPQIRIQQNIQDET
jgi:hypothetical protein